MKVGVGGAGVWDDVALVGVVRKGEVVEVKVEVEVEVEGAVEGAV